MTKRFIKYAHTYAFLLDDVEVRITLALDFPSSQGILF